MMDQFFNSESEQDLKNDDTGKSKLQLITLACLFISAKYNEKDSRGPTARDFEELTKKRYTEKQVIEAEIEIMKVLSWDIMFSTPADYIHLFLSQGVLFSDDKIVSNTSSLRDEKRASERVAEYIRKYAEFFVDLCL